MTPQPSHPAISRRSRWHVPMMAALSVLTGGSLLAAASVPASAPAGHHRGYSYFRPGNLLVSRSVYDAGGVDLVPGVTVLPPGCTSGCVLATNDGIYPQVGQRPGGRQLRDNVAGLPRPDPPVRPSGQHAAGPGRIGGGS
jgi:hypothetical protein